MSGLSGQLAGERAMKLSSSRVTANDSTRVTHWRSKTGTCIGYSWASTPLEHWGSSAEDARIEAPCAARGWGLERGCAPSQKIYEFSISKWCDMVQMKMAATCGIPKFR